MQSGNKVIVVIPVYKQSLPDDEIISLQRVIKVLSKNDFSIVCAKSLDIKQYTHYFEGAGTGFSVDRFDDKYFRSISDYNRLMLSPNFYSRFQTWQYMIIYQLDCFIFKDEVEKWITGDFDYVGAPWVSYDQSLNFYRSLIYSRWKLIGLLKKSIDFNRGEKIFVGNGGCSIRKVKKFANISKILHLFFKRHLRGHVNEDFIWSVLATKYFRNFKVPTVTVASQFALEEINHPVDLDSMETLPMAAHAWKRYYPDLWQSIIVKFR
jgi:hypothetical protein